MEIFLHGAELDLVQHKDLYIKWMHLLTERYKCVVWLPKNLLGKQVNLTKTPNILCVDIYLSPHLTTLYCSLVETYIESNIFIKKEELFTKIDYLCQRRNICNNK